MTTRPFPDPQDEDDLIAAEYVLGVLDATERAQAKARAETDPAFARRVAQWETRLLPLADTVAPVPAPDLFPAIEARLFPAAPSAPRGWRWPVLGLGKRMAGGLVAALLLVAVALWTVAPGPAPQPVLVAALDATDDTGARFAASFDGATLELVRLGAAPASDRDHQLWRIGADGVPRSLGLVRASPLRLPVSLEQGEVLAISLEPLGGAPGEAPTGPVVAVGSLLPA